MGKGTSKAGNGGGMVAAPVKDIRVELSEFAEDLNNRIYGSSKKLVPQTQQDEFRRIKSDVKDWLKDNPEQETVILAGGFRTGAKDPENYIHNTAKLNSYQRIVRSEARNISTDLSLGIINEQEARLELKALKSIDKMIKQRRELL